MINLLTKGWEWTAKATNQVTSGYKQSEHPENLTQSELKSSETVDPLHY